MRLLITGGSGYVGAGILRRAPNDWTIAATYFAHPIEQSGVVARKRPPLAWAPFWKSHGRRMLATCHVDIRDVDAVNRLFDEFHPDVVIHTAALMAGDEMIATNTDGSRNLARAAARFNARLIHLSSDVIFDGEHAPYDEDAAPAPITPYAMSKALAEAVVRREAARALIVRTSLVYGFAPMDPRTRQTLGGAMPRLFTDEYRCPIFVDDLAEALIERALSFRAEREISEHGNEISRRRSFDSTPLRSVPLRTPPRNDIPFSVLNIAGPQRLSRYEFGVKLARAFRVKPRFQPALSASSPTPRPRDCTLDISRAQRTLRTRLRSVDETLALL